MFPEKDQPSPVKLKIFKKLEPIFTSRELRPPIKMTGKGDQTTNE
jgi:hypothetical protein